MPKVANLSQQYNETSIITTYMIVKNFKKGNRDRKWKNYGNKLEFKKLGNK